MKVDSRLRYSGMTEAKNSYVFARFRIASTVFCSRLRLGLMSSITDSTRALSYPIWTSEEISVVSLVYFFPSVHDFFVKSIEPLRSTMIFCAVFLPIPGTLEMSLSSSRWIAWIRVSRPSPRRERAVLPHTPFTLRRSRKSERSSRSINPNNTSLISVRWWWIHVLILASELICPRRRGDARTSSPRPVHSMRSVIADPSIERTAPWI